MTTWAVEVNAFNPLVARGISSASLNQQCTGYFRSGEASRYTLPCTLTLRLVASLAANF